LSLRV